jgi:HD-GYP domain-containing protein (c-di-GMP phosphodiesterase class II)
MSLISLPHRHLHLRAALPFRVYDANGMLMLASGTAIEYEAQLQALRSKLLYVDESEAHDWLEQANQTVQTLMLHDAPLQQIAVARWRDTGGAAALTRESLGRTGGDNASRQHRPSALDTKISLVERWESQMQQVNGLLREGQRDSGWIERLYLTVTIANSLAESHPNEVLFLMVQHAAHQTRHYSSHHAALCAVICTRVANALKWTDDEVQALSLAAITMNLSMTTLQDRLATQKEPPTPEQREQIQSHALRSASELAAIGVRDPRWLKVVRLHHDRSLLETPLAQLDASSRLARLLGVVDRFTAKVSRRTSRSPMSPLAAARDACVGPDGRPDELGSALLKTLGMYPPGSYVQLATGEIGVVLARGGKANEPMVAALVGASGLPLAEPVLRDTSRSGRTVTGAVAVADVRVRIHHEKLLDLI